MSSLDIRSAREIGRLLRRAREEQSANLNHLSKRCGLSVAQLVHIESGNLFALKGDLNKMMINYKIYSQALNVNLNALDQNVTLATSDHELTPLDGFIPQFLKKTENI